MKRHQPALLGGLLIGVLSSLPVVNFANCCCLWVICGGLLTVYLQQQNKMDPIETSEAVLGGLIAGVVGGIIGAFVDVLQLALATQVVDFSTKIREALDKNPGMPQEYKDMAVRIFEGKGLVFLICIQFLKVPIYAVFSMLGALLGLAFFRKKTPPVAQG